MKKLCKACKSEIDPKATKCAKCGADQRNWFRRHPVLTVILALFVIGMIGSASGDKGTSTSQVTSSNKSQTSQKPQEEAMVVDATALVGEFDKNKLAANDKYKGKLVQTTAYISNISGGDIGNYYLVLKPSADQYYFGTNIQAFFEDKGELTSLSNGEKVTIQGTMGEMSLGQVIIEDTSIVK